MDSSSDEEPLFIRRQRRLERALITPQKRPWNQVYHSPSNIITPRRSIVSGMEGPPDGDDHGTAGPAAPRSVDEGPSQSNVPPESHPPSQGEAPGSMNDPVRRAPPSLPRTTQQIEKGILHPGTPSLWQGAESDFSSVPWPGTTMTNVTNCLLQRSDDLNRRLQRLEDDCKHALFEAMRLVVREEVQRSLGLGLNEQSVREIVRQELQAKKDMNAETQINPTAPYAKSNEDSLFVGQPMNAATRVNPAAPDARSSEDSLFVERRPDDPRKIGQSMSGPLPPEPPISKPSEAGAATLDIDSPEKPSAQSSPGAVYSDDSPPRKRVRKSGDASPTTSLTRRPVLLKQRRSSIIPQSQQRRTPAFRENYIPHREGSNLGQTRSSQGRKDSVQSPDKTQPGLGDATNQRQRVVPFQEESPPPPARGSTIEATSSGTAAAAPAPLAEKRKKKGIAQRIQLADYSARQKK